MHVFLLPEKTVDALGALPTLLPNFRRYVYNTPDRVRWGGQRAVVLLFSRVNSEICVGRDRTKREVSCDTPPPPVITELVDKHTHRGRETRRDFHWIFFFAL